MYLPYCWLSKKPLDNIHCRRFTSGRSQGKWSLAWSLVRSTAGEVCFHNPARRWCIDAVIRGNWNSVTSTPGESLNFAGNSWKTRNPRNCADLEASLHDGLPRALINQWSDLEFPRWPKDGLTIIIQEYIVFFIQVSYSSGNPHSVEWEAYLVSVWRRWRLWPQTCMYAASYFKIWVTLLLVLTNANGVYYEGIWKAFLQLFIVPRFLIKLP